MKKNRTIIFVVIIIAVLVWIGGIYILQNRNDLSFSSDKIEAKDTTVDELETIVDIDSSDEEIEWSDYENRNITLTKSITIKEAGVYNLSGKINNGLITVNTDKDVNLVLNNVEITNNNGPTIYIESANQVVITTVAGTTNKLTDGSSYSSSFEKEVEGAIYSKDDLILEGEGTLIVNGNKGDAIVSKDDLKINSGTYQITSVDDGIRGKDSVYIINGSFTINSSGDGIKSTNDTETEKGYIKIENGTFNITSTLDGIQAETKVLISGGTYNIKTGGGSSNSSDKEGWGNWRNDTSTDSISAKGIKALDNIVITNGSFILNTSDDSIHSNNYVGISDGTYNISSGDDGIHADKELIIDNGTINITKSYEGLEAETITINNGNIDIVASDDGINVAGGNDSSAYGRPGGNPNANSSSGSTLMINGGTINVDASGDGLDANGSIFINGGKTIVNGPTNGGNGTLDYDQQCVIKAGTIIGIGSSGMAQGTSSSSTQYGVMITFTNTYSSGTKVTIENANGVEVMSYTAKKTFSNVIFSSSALNKGTYTIKVNGSTYDTFDINNISTTVGSGGNFGGGRDPHGGR